METMNFVRRRFPSFVVTAFLLLGLGATLQQVACSRSSDTAPAPRESQNPAAGPIKIGILHSLSGTMAISETILKDFMLMQVADLNAKGGLLGRKIEPVVVDPASNRPLFAEKAGEFLQPDKVAAVWPLDVRFTQVGATGLRRAEWPPLLSPMSD